MVNYNPGVFWCPRSDIRECPRRLKLYKTLKQTLVTIVIMKPDTKLSDIEQEQIQTWSCGKSSLARNSTKRGTTPECITSLIGGQRSIESSFRKWVVPSSCEFLSSDQTPAIIAGRVSNCNQIRLAKPSPPFKHADF